MSNESRKPDEKPDAEPRAHGNGKRPWSAPRIVSMQTAFEHSILQCNGVTRTGGALRSPKGLCTSGGTALS
jgi:hypothetical protein